MTSRQSWEGSFFELALDLGPRDGSELDRAGEYIWSSAGVKRDAKPEIPGLETGTIALPRGPAIACAVVKTVEETTWVALGIPAGELEEHFAVRYPLHQLRNPWIRPLEQALVRVADAVYPAVKFRLGLIGEEASGRWTADDESGAFAASVDERGGFLLPPELSARLKLTFDSSVTRSGLTFVPLRLH